MASAALTSFLTGITEPLEFAFLFVAPVLFRDSLSVCRSIIHDHAFTGREKSG
ncbi:PTS transporter subunit EIIC [Peribacillus frigoritolerans]|nr:PTS transporter subunit EIIC [Peribacillus frigoritolerans]